MRLASSLVIVCALAGCDGNTIDAGSRDAGDGDALSDAGPAPIATFVQLVPTQLVSDGTSLFWISEVLDGDLLLNSGSPLFSVAVGGGAIRTVVPGPVDLLGGPSLRELGYSDEDAFLAVDDENVYYPADYPDPIDIDEAPKDGAGTATVVTNQTDVLTVLGKNLYWLASDPSGTFRVQELQGGQISTIAQGHMDPGHTFGAIGVTATTVFLQYEDEDGLFFLPIGAGTSDAGPPAMVPPLAAQCASMVSDVDAVYCQTTSSTIVRVADDGTATLLGAFAAPAAIESTTAGASLAVDDKYAYWLDAVPDGKINRVPKTGGTPAVIARDTSPIALAVDDHAIYWSDLGGNIMRLAK